MKRIYSLIGCAFLLAGAFVVSSCSENKMLGSWKGVVPVNLANSVAGASESSFVPVITFKEGQDKKGGDVSVSGEVSIEKRLSSLSGGEILMAATGMSDVKGKWSYDIDDDDDLLLDLDIKSLEVKFDKDDMSFSGPGYTVLTNEQRDSLISAELDICVMETRKALKSEFVRFSLIEDVEVSKDGRTLGFEIKSPKTDLRFRKIGD